jgi:hypothetical protein
MLKLILTFFLSLIIFSCSVKTHTLTVRYENSPTPAVPDYSKIESWAALPNKVDAADSTPKKSNVTNNQVSAKADVFFVYPTIFTNAPKNEYQWNADVNDGVLNNDIQRSTLLNQATAFNGACRVFAPYYRQAHLFAFYTPNPEDGKQALELAYQDVKAAFEYYLEHYNQGRPIVIASHSQGVTIASDCYKIILMEKNYKTNWLLHI